MFSLKISFCFTLKHIILSLTILHAHVRYSVFLYMWPFSFVFILKGIGLLALNGSTSSPIGIGLLMNRPSIKDLIIRWYLCSEIPRNQKTEGLSFHPLSNHGSRTHLRSCAVVLISILRLRSRTGRVAMHRIMRVIVCLCMYYSLITLSKYVSGL